MGTDNKRKTPDTDEKPGLPPAGPHGRDELTEEDKTPGAGSLPDADNRDREVDPGAG